MKLLLLRVIQGLLSGAQLGPQTRQDLDIALQLARQFLALLRLKAANLSLLFL